MIHGRFQPFHNGHLEYLRGAAAHSDVVFVGITNPDPSRIKEESSDPLRHLPESNPFSYVERLLMVAEVAHDEGIRAHVIPFPVNEPELWPAYVPAGVTQFLRLFSEWGGTKLERLREAGVDLPATVPDSLVLVGLGSLATIFVLIRLISIPDAFFGWRGRGIGIFISLIASLLVIAAGLLRASEEL